jgi:hypothetical protein
MERPLNDHSGHYMSWTDLDLDALPSIQTCIIILVCIQVQVVHIARYDVCLRFAGRLNTSMTHPGVCRQNGFASRVTVTWMSYRCGYKSILPSLFDELERLGRTYNEALRLISRDSSSSLNPSWGSRKPSALRVVPTSNSQEMSTTAVPPL